MNKKPKKYKINPYAGLKELRENMELYINEVEKGKEFLIMRKSRPIFKIVPVDEWGDEGEWTGVDLRDKKGRGMPAEKFLKILKKINGQK